jgi:hypothetical protein
VEGYVVDEFLVALVECYVADKFNACVFFQFRSFLLFFVAEVIPCLCTKYNTYTVMLSMR